MEIFLKATAGILIALVLYLVLSKQSKDFSLLLTVTICCMIAVSAMYYLQPVISFFDRLQSLGNLNNQLLNILIKSVGIALISEITTLVCVDTGNAALGKTLQILACATVLWLSLPLFTNLIDLVEEILVSV